MATVTGGNVYVLDFEAIEIANIFNYQYASLKSTSAKFYDNASNYTLFQGRGLTYYSDGEPKSGVVTSASFVANGATVIKITGLNDVPATTIADYAYANNTLGLLSIALAGTDTITGTAGPDVLYGFGGNDVIKGGVGSDRLMGGNGNDTLRGDSGADRLDGGVGVDTLIGGSDSDTYIVDNIADVILEGASEGTADRLTASVDYGLKSGVYVEFMATASSIGTAAIDLTGNALKQDVTGNAGANILNEGGVGAADKLAGLGGNDTYRVYNSGAVIVESSSQGTADRIISSTDYKLSAGVYIEQLTTNSSTATAAIDFTGNEVGQKFTGNAGSNIIDGKGGNDTMTGLAGKDYFVFSSALGAGNIDTITDFQPVDDTIRLENAVFKALTATGTLAASAFRANTTGLAGDTTDRIIFETDTGNLFYDADGTGTAARVQFAVLDAGLKLTAADFVVI
ncbi:calcium-binding protein [Mesorhizobium sp. CN2-181]|uniref:calcium-binding protein n=1 Tax=Mesorhizobium yinganensis TaxID=3157707 RepID=UPI0032B86BCB